MPPLLHTDRLILRPFTPADSAAAYDVLETHPDVWRYDPGFARTRQQRAELILKYSLTNDDQGCGTLAVTLPTGQLIGYVGLQFYVLPRAPLATPEVELYYKLGRDFWNHGYATEACQRLIRFAFDQMHLQRIVTIIRSDNAPSIKLVERLGMQVAPAPAAWSGFVMATLAHQPPPGEHPRPVA